MWWCGLHTSLPPGKIGLAPWPMPKGDVRGESAYGPNAGETEVLIPAGYVRTVYDPVFRLNADKTKLRGVEQRHADDTAGAWAAVLAGVQGRTRRRGPDSEGRVRLRSCVQASRLAPAFGPLRSGTTTTSSAPAAP